MKILVDVNLSPEWIDALKRNSIESVHWTSVGDPRAPDRAIMNWAREHGYVVFTHDLDFSAILALSGATGPSVIQVRAQDIRPTHLEKMVASALMEHKQALVEGALVVLDEMRSRVRILPLKD